MIGYEMVPLGESAVVIRLGERIEERVHQLVKALSARLMAEPITGFVECVPAFTTVTVYYDPWVVMAAQDAKEAKRSPYDLICATIEPILASLTDGVQESTTVVEIPVCYGGEFGPDLAFVAAHNGLTPEDVIRIHTTGEYIVYMIGFAPGFPYLGGLSEQIHAPRRPSPRLAIPTGTVGIAGSQTGVYPIETPGGWQLIGRTPIALFRPQENPPSLLQAGNLVKFRAISPDEFAALSETEAEVEAGREARSTKEGMAR